MLLNIILIGELCLIFLWWEEKALRAFLRSDRIRNKQAVFDNYAECHRAGSCIISQTIMPYRNKTFLGLLPRLSQYPTVLRIERFAGASGRDAELSFLVSVAYMAGWVTCL